MVEVCLLPEGKPLLKSYTYFDNQNPQFNEHFVFKVSPTNLKNKYLRFTVYDEKRKHILTPIGHVLYSLKGHGQDGVPIERKTIERNLKLNSLVRLLQQWYLLWWWDYCRRIRPTTPG